ncbi:protachykinin-like isoform X2 [Gopherus flavomarginatus]|uniref:protachykinin-like isoform X2 n=1 Tax=Gopherus flavomarginatus TaxID=286002 RepID=UPI0021CC39E3|nr:protachykinin-like isoform X2 [Gopherus flavomarginatus]
MESFRAFFLLVFLCSQIFCFEDVPSLEEDPGTAPSLKDEGLQSGSLQRLAQLMKRGKFQQFYGLMGKRASGHQGQTFIGLMGRRSSSGESTQDWDNGQPLPAWEP